MEVICTQMIIEAMGMVRVTQEEKMRTGTNPSGILTFKIYKRWMSL